MTQSALRVALAQLHFRVGDIDANAAQMIAVATQARNEYRADVVVFPEMALSGYPLDDLLLRRDLPAAVDRALADLRASSQGITVVFGYPEFAAGRSFNATAVLRDGEFIAGGRKQQLANNGEFNEKRYFTAGCGHCVFTHAGVRVAVGIAADLEQYAANATTAAAQVLICLDAATFCSNAREACEQRLVQCAQSSSVAVCYVNHTGGQDELVFTGGSCAIAADATFMVRAPAFASGLYMMAWPPADAVPCPPPQATIEAQIYDALVQATRDYVVDNGFPSVLLGASGGIDSALVMAIAADALGGGHVHAVAMPTRYTADISNADAAEQATRLGVRYQELPIEALFEGFLDTLAPMFGELPVDATEENLQARIRGTLLMALSNKFGGLLLATGNKSELAVGYATLYGDMCGGFAPLKDVYKTWVYRLARFRNTRSAVIPERVISRPPSAELRADQADSDSLPDYPTLDAIIAAYVEADESVQALCERGYDRAMVERVTRLIRRNEYKRRQAAPGPKVSQRDFGRARHYPISARWAAL